MSLNYKGVQIELLDGSDLARSIFKRTKTKELLENIFQLINIIEKDYFGLYYTNLQTDDRVWLKNNDSVWTQIVKILDPPYQLFFGVKYFPYDPLLLQEDITLYMMYLQLRREVKDGRVICSERERAEMLAYILQAEGGDDGEGFIHKHRNFFVNLQKSSPQMETILLEKYHTLKGTDAPMCEMKLMEKALPTCYYNQEVFNVRSEAQPGLGRLKLTLGPIGIGLYQSSVKLDIFGWMELWNVGYINQTFWFRIVRDGEKSKHKFHFENNKVCEHVWKAFRNYFQFYTQERKVDSKLLWGRIAPKINRVTLFTEHGTPSRTNIGIHPRISKDNISSLMADPSGPGGNSLLQEHYGIKDSKQGERRLLSTYTADNTLTGTSNSRNKEETAGEKLQSLFESNYQEHNENNVFVVTNTSNGKVESLDNLSKD